VDLRLTERHLAFRDELRAWLAANLLEQQYGSTEVQLERALAAAGY
jgi:hypothetical protein